MFRKTIICVAGILAGVSAGAYSNGYFNRDNVVTTKYNQAMDSMGLDGQVDASMSNGMGVGEADSLVSNGRDGSNSAERASLLSDVDSSEHGNLAYDLLDTNRGSSARGDQPLASGGSRSATEDKVVTSRKEIQERMRAAQRRKMAAQRRKMAEEEKNRMEEALRQAQALVEDRFSEEVYTSTTGEQLNYRKLVPNNIQKNKLLPLVIFLHGRGERGDDNQSQLKHGLKLFAADEGMKRFPAIVIAPQCPADQLWADTLQQKDTTPKMDPQPTAAMRLVIELLDSMLLTESVDPNRVYVTGLSMGGFGTFDLIARRPTVFAAAAPLCGGGDPSPAATRRLLQMPMWVVHGTEDNVININRSREMVYALESAGATPRYSELAGFGHNIWDATYGDLELYNWMFNQSKSGVINPRRQQPQARKTNNATRSTVAARGRSASPSRTPTPLVRRPTSTQNRSQALLGQWKVLAASQNGKQANKQALEEMSVTFGRGQFVIQIGDRKEVAKFNLGNSGTIPQIDILSNRNGRKGSAGIYELQGNKLIISWSEPGLARPTRFANLKNVKSLVLEKQ